MDDAATLFEVGARAAGSHVDTGGPLGAGYIAAASRLIRDPRARTTLRRGVRVEFGRLIVRRLRNRRATEPENVARALRNILRVVSRGRIGGNIDIAGVLAHVRCVQGPFALDPLDL